MEHQHHGMPVSGAFFPNDPFLFALTIIFLGMTMFYIVRLFFPKKISACCGFFSLWNELAHAWCGIGMVAMVAPALVPISPLTFKWTFFALSIAYALYSFAERERPTRLWRVLHVGIYFYMGAMFDRALMHQPAIVFTAITLYSYATWYFGKWMLIGLFTRPFHGFDWGAKFFHTKMTLIMGGMYLFPSFFMDMDLCASMEKYSFRFNVDIVSECAYEDHPLRASGDLHFPE